MNRSLKLSMLVALALGSSQVMALDLGKVQIKSALGQPLLAEIPLHPTHPGELQGLTVQLASSDEFARAGIAVGRTSIPLHFSVAGTGSAHPVIRITSSVAVDDPFLDLLIEVNGKAGKSVREYAILLDPPGSQETAPVAAAATPKAAGSSKAAMTAPKAVAAKPAKPAKSAPSLNGGEYGPVQAGQTLSAIARSTAPAGVDVQQMMLALQQANPDAFYRNNINALKRGAVLRMPSSAEAKAMTLAAAAAEVRRQNSDWRAGTPGQPAVVANAASRTSNAGTPGSAPIGNEDRLALVPPKVGGGAGNQGGAGSREDKSAASVRADLLRARESMASLQQQSSDLKTRLKDLTDINNKNEHLLSLKDSEIAELQAKLAAARKASAKPEAGAEASVAKAAPIPVPTATPTATSSEPPAASSSSGSMVASASTASAPVAAESSAMSMAAPGVASSSPVSASTAAMAAASKPAEVKPLAKPAASKPTPAPVKNIEQPWYMQTWAWAAGAGALLLLIVLALLGRRRKPAAAASKSASSLADRFGSAAPGDDHLLDDGDNDQEQLLDQLAEHPDDIYLHLELVTLYYSRRDVEHFEAAAEAMYAHVSDPAQDEWQDVLHMGEDLVPEHPLFNHHQEAPAEAAAGSSFDIDDYAAAADAPTVVSSVPPATPKKVSEYNFNFDLTQPHAAEPAADHKVAADDATVVAPHVETESAWQDDAQAHTHAADDRGSDAVEFSDDPIDTKLDLARAYLDMGDADGARAMLGEVLKEGSQIQRDAARRLLDSLA